MYVPRGYLSTIKIAVPVDLTATINITKDGTIIPPFTVVSANNILDIALPYSAINSEGSLSVSVVFTVDSVSYTRTEKIEVYTPYLELWQIKEIMDSAEDDECWKVERAVRNIINAHCGQSFGYGTKTIKVQGNGDKILHMPEKLVTLNTLSEGTNVRFDRTNTTNQQTFLGDGQFIVTGDGWFLKIPEWNNGSWYGTYTSQNPIVAPSRVSGKYRNNIEYTITGVFGYESVPEGVVEAAKLLVNDYACAEQIYRDRFLESIIGSDWTLHYYSAAYYRTGNARANLLLSPYVVNRMKVI